MFGRAPAYPFSQILAPRLLQELSADPRCRHPENVRRSPIANQASYRMARSIRFTPTLGKHMAKKVAEIFIETLVNAGVERVYGVVGDSLNGLTEIIRKSKQIEWLHVRHEEVAAFAAGAEAHLTGEIAVCAGSCGPGNLHLINGLFDCHRNRVPVLAIAAQIPSHEIGSDYFQETRPDHLFNPNLRSWPSPLIFLAFTWKNRKSCARP
jgi:hypothetical protein